MMNSEDLEVENIGTDEFEISLKWHYIFTCAICTMLMLYM